MQLLIIQFFINQLLFSFFLFHSLLFSYYAAFYYTVLYRSAFYYSIPYYLVILRLLIIRLPTMRFFILYISWFWGWLRSYMMAAFLFDVWWLIAVMFKKFVIDYVNFCINIINITMK